VAEEDVSRPANAFSYPRERNVVDTTGLIEPNRTPSKVSRSNERCPLLDELPRARPVFTVIAIFDEEDSVALQFGDGKCRPVVHAPRML
jgi:hypothetical protein